MSWTKPPAAPRMVPAITPTGAHPSQRSTRKPTTAPARMVPTKFHATATYLPARRSGLTPPTQQLVKARRAAAAIRSMCAAVWASDRNTASNCDGAM